jgi:hypothetical protein
MHFVNLLVNLMLKAQGREMKKKKLALVLGR